MFTMHRIRPSVLLLVMTLGGMRCASTDVQPDPPADMPDAPGEGLAEVRAVTVSGAPGAYTFSVEVASSDTGCERYADWWEVLAEDGTLLYRRVLLHSHVNEQPFVRSGGPVPAAADRRVIVRAHMHPEGYGRQAMAGTAADGFATVRLDDGFAAGVASMEPLPDGCAF